MRHVRMLVLCLVAMFAMSAMTYAVASPAMASCNEQCQKEKQEAKEQKEKEKQEAKEQKEKEKQEAKERKEEEKEKRLSGAERKFEETGVQALKESCPTENLEISDCFVGRTLGGSGGGFFQLGDVLVPLNEPITIHGGLSKKQLYVIPPKGGLETLESPLLKVPGGIKLITPTIERLAEWPEEVQAAFKEAVKNKETELTVKIEVAGEELYKIEHAVDEFNLAYEEGDAFILPLKVSLHNSFLEKLGGGPCEVGNDEHPIYQHLTTEPEKSGTGGYAQFYRGGTLLGIHGSRLTDISWEVPNGAQAQGCGGIYEAYVDEAINLLLLGDHLEKPEYWEHGFTMLTGNLWQQSRAAVEKDD